MLWLLDTCVVSEALRRQADAAVVKWLEAHTARAALPVIALGEIQYGIERLEPGRRRNALQAWRDTLQARYADRTLDVGEPILRVWARLRASLDAIGRPQQDMDILIAATALAHNLTLVTRNTRHFADTGVRLFDPWTGKHA
ncbi:type II toxin-antitoxin system VapC family toxin [Ramlibacter tataouinensis]|uniref:Ribonuclease VapC n=1 Tax=Ramlibacter tataouinensis (strain ATCC BAA-407 / DSM 14655 / LMG 21543 / TTB310) TaxID=365046 RepID=F5Y199_RAMTT|nr:type II toxin-antitoxin system VapC family toxin [Ramlibacter tataouinensis]AEG93500.1 plasmid stability protein stbB-like protein [Ramlibacter tataouinensis TTB310]